MFLNNDNEFAASQGIEDLLYPSAKTASGSATFLPSMALFERFGICGDCMAVCRRGSIPLIDLRPSDEILTRSHGWVSTLCMMVYSAHKDSGKLPLTTHVGEGSLGSGLPQGDIALGAQNQITRYVMPKNARRPSSVSLHLSATAEQAALRNCSVDNLCVPVFRESLEILVQGIYVGCPALVDVAEKSTVSIAS